MMNAINELKNEHAAVKMTLTVLDRMISRLEREPDQKIVEHLDQLVGFFQVFVDKCHHGKEEDILFPALVKLGVNRDGGPIGEMLSEHEQGRGYIKGLKEAVEKIKKGQASGVVEAAENATSYIELLNNHIEKEEKVLFQIGEEGFSEAEQAALYAAFEKLEEEKIGIGKHEELHQLLDGLKGIYLE
ncbi:hemerythrin domain-containing protein [Psychromonas sp.]|uniref:hemerythrin domain-containing protein n=1 Tax=Psychromonas sp. TaxID=1884585 RepID=UPI00356A8CBB